MSNSIGSENVFPAARPRIDLPRTTQDNALELLAAVGLILGIYLLIRYYPQLPSRIPGHFGIDGQPDSWRDKGLIFLLPATSLVIFAALAILERYPHVYNYPYPITPANFRKQYALARTLLGWLNAEIVWLITFVEWKIIEIAMRRAFGLGGMFFILFIAVILGTVLWYFRLAYNNK